MNSTSSEQVKRRICDELATRRLSISHDRWHLERVLSFAQQLQAIHGGDLDVITVAALLHDLGRTEPNLHGRASAAKSMEEAREILSVVELPLSRIEAIVLAIQEHDQPELRPSTIEGRILKDADFLAGFGAWGILRIAMWAAETDRGVPQVFDRLENRMPKRLENLEFPESVRLAKKDALFTSLFLARLQKPPPVIQCHSKGKYVVLEGISGSGKDTQADVLKRRLEGIGHSVVKVSEPAGQYQHARDNWGPGGSDPVIQTFLLLADRYEVVRGSVEPALARGDTVLSVRSFLSTLVHQYQDVLDWQTTAFIHEFVPPPDLVILYDLDADLAYERCSERAKADMAKAGSFEGKEALQRHRQLYLDLIREMPELRVKVIDASRSIEKVAELTWRAGEARIV